jgi:HEAT repeat protein
VEQAIEPVRDSGLVEGRRHDRVEAKPPRLCSILSAIVFVLFVRYISLTQEVRHAKRFGSVVGARSVSEIADDSILHQYGSREGHMTRRSALKNLLSVAGLLLCPHAVPQEPNQIASQEASRGKAWDILRAGAHAANFDKRANAIQALGLTSGDSDAVQLAEEALHDNEPTVRAAAAKALGAMISTKSIPRLRDALSDKDISVCLAAAHSLVQLKEHSGYELYYDVLMGERKGGNSLIAGQLNDLKTPERAIKFAFDQGIGFVPYAGYGMEAVRAWKKRSTAPTLAAAARELAEDPDPRTSRALAKAASDRNWVVRAAALEAIAKRGDPALLESAAQEMSDKKDIVRFSAAAAVLQLTHIAEGRGEKSP